MPEHLKLHPLRPGFSWLKERGGPRFRRPGGEHICIVTAGVSAVAASHQGFRGRRPERLTAAAQIEAAAVGEASAAAAQIEAAAVGEASAAAAGTEADTEAALGLRQILCLRHGQHAYARSP